MSAVFIRRAVLSWSATLAALFFASSLQPQELHSQPTIVIVEKDEGHATYKVDSKPTRDLLYALNQIADREGVNHPVLVFVDHRLPVEEIWNVNGVAGKAQLTNLRFFIIFSENHMMTEINWTPFSPFSTNPPPNRLLPGRSDD